MPLKCPVCRVENAQGPTCRRCKADLLMLFALEEQRGYLLNEARAAITTGRWAEALGPASEADALRRDEESLRLVAVAALLARDFSLAWRTYGLLKEDDSRELIEA
jgi:hypothetical protein